MSDTCPCCLCDRETPRDETMIFVVHLPKKVLLPPTSRGAVANTKDHTITYSLCSQRCMSVWALVISETADPSSGLSKLASELSEEELKNRLSESIEEVRAMEKATMPKVKGNN